MTTLQSGINVGPMFINFGFFSRPYCLIRQQIKVILMVIYYIEHVYLISNSDAKDSICNQQGYRLCSMCSSTAADANTAYSPAQLQILSLALPYVYSGGQSKLTYNAMDNFHPCQSIFTVCITATKCCLNLALNVIYYQKKNYIHLS